MEYRLLGQTGLKVSRLCFGSLTISPLQANLPLLDGANVILAALAAGVNFIDTADLYNNYDYIGYALREFASNVIVASKSYAYTYEDMQASVERACREIGRDYVDIFMLHEQTSWLTLKGHGDALKYLVDAKHKGIIRAVGVSTHAVEVVRSAALMAEVDVIHPILNIKGLGILDGSVQDMLKAIAFAHECGKGIYTMKALGGGHLSANSPAALAWILRQPHISAVAVGMQNVDEVSFNCAVFSGQDTSAEMADKVVGRKRRLLIEDWCAGCGKCAQKCPMHAITIVHGKAVPDVNKCVLCGYCGAYCPEFCIKVI